MSTQSRLLDALTTGGYRTAWRLVKAMPERTAYQAFESAADAMVARGGKDVQRMRANYARVRPELDPAQLHELTRQGVRSYLRYWCDAFRLPTMGPDDINRRFRLENGESLRAELAAGRPVIGFLGHLGNWDLAGAWGTQNLAPIVTVAERLKPESLFQEFLDFRESIGLQILPLTGGGNVFAQLRERLHGPVLMPLLADRDLTSRGIPAPLAGQQISAAVGPAALAVSTGAMLVPISITYERTSATRNGWGSVARIHDPAVDPREGTTAQRVAAMTAHCTGALGEVVRAQTQDWHMMQRVFSADLRPRAGASR